MNEKEIRAIDLFGGIGGFRLGLENACSNQLQTQSRRWIENKGKKVEQSSSKFTSKGRENTRKFRCVWYCDKDKYAVQTYNKNFKENHEPTDITTVDAKDIPDFDMLCAGFPCQSFSVAGKREGFQDTRGSLFFEICRIAQAKKPRMLFLENVKGLLSHDKGKTYRIILKSLDELGYNVEWQVLNSKNFGVPQNRERVFIIGHLRGSGGGQVFPLGEASSISYESCEEAQGERAWLRVENSLGVGGSFKERNLIANTLSHRYGKDGSENLIMLSHTKANIKQREQKRDTTWTLDQIASKMALIKNRGIRRLTPIECERLQGFPDGWTGGVSDTQRYKQLGNAVTVNVIEAIGKRILDGLWVDK